jgi:hypothetical protein
MLYGNNSEERRGATGVLVEFAAGILSGIKLAQERMGLGGHGRHNRVIWTGLAMSGNELAPEN